MMADQIAEERRSPPRPEREEPSFADVRARVTEVERHARALIQQRPIVAVLAAVGLGYLTARLVSRVMR